MLWASIKGFEMDLNHGEGWEDRGCRDGIGALGEGNRMGGWVPVFVVGANSLTGIMNNKNDRPAHIHNGP